MRKKVCDVEYWICVLLTYYDLMSLAVVCKYNAVYSKRNSCPLVLLDTAIVVCLEVNSIVILIDRIGL